MRGRVLRIVGIVGSAGMLLACGGSGGGATSPAGPGAPAPSPTTAPAPVTAPTPTPTPVATPTPTPSVPVAKVVIKIEFIDCPATGEVFQGGPYNWTSVGCRIHLDLTAKDRYNKPVQGKRDPEWHVNNPSLVSVRGERSYTPVLVAQTTGKLLIQGEQDGVKSNSVQIWLY